MSDEWIDLESRLRRVQASEPPDLRDRVMRTVNAELASSRTLPLKNGNWYWPAIAASALIVMNLSMVSASQETFAPRAVPSRQEWTAEIHALQSVSVQQEGLLK
jgi:hypothetical protein